MFQSQLLPIISELSEILETNYLSFYYIGFVLILLFFYYLFPGRFRWFVLLLGSLAFYALSGLYALFLIIMSCVIVYFCGRLMELFDKSQKRDRRLLLFLGILPLFAVLFLLKGIFISGFQISILMPLGISYYTFSAISYLADLYWGKVKAERNIFRLFLFLLYFPKIVQGPISRYKNFAPQLSGENHLTWQNLSRGASLALYGYFKKLVLADRIAIFTSAVFSDVSSHGGGILAFAVILSAIQLYFDFSGCMDIAVGISQMFGITLEKNFNHPFFSRSAAEFWRRWHITLGSWVKDYLYMPISISGFMIRTTKIFRKFGKRAGRAWSTVIPLLVSWVFTGLWHGTGWNYLVWGLYWGGLIWISQVLAPESRRVLSALQIPADSIGWKRVQIIRTFVLFCIGRLLTIPDSLTISVQWIRKILFDFRPWQLVDGNTIYTLGLDWREWFIVLTGILTVYVISRKQEKGSLRDEISGWSIPARGIFFTIGLLAVLIFGIYGPGIDMNTFTYANF